MRKILIFSIVLNIVLAGILFSCVPLETGGGQYKEKNEWIANASSFKDLNPLRNDQVFYEFTVQTVSTREPKIKVQFSPSNATEEMVMRTYPEVITWSETGHEVRFVTPEIEVTLKNLQQSH